MQSLFIKLKKLSLIYQNPRHDGDGRISPISQFYAFTAALTVVQKSRHFGMTNTLAIISHQNLTGIKYKLEYLKYDDCCHLYLQEIPFRVRNFLFAFPANEMK